MSFSLLYSDLDAAAFFSYVDAFAERMGMENFLLNANACIGVLDMMKHEFPHNDGIEAASPFKKIAHFLTNFVAASPIIDKFPEDKIGDLFNVPNHQNAIVAYEISADSLCKAKIKHDGKTIILENRICVSKHSYIDIIEALSSLTPIDHFKLVSVLIEQLAYRANPKASYTLT